LRNEINANEGDVGPCNDDMEKAYAELKKQARKRGADAIILFKDSYEERTTYETTPKESGRRSKTIMTYIGPKSGNVKFLNDSKYENKFVHYGKYVTGQMVLYKETDNAVPRLLRSLKSFFNYRRQGAISALAVINDKRSIGPLMNIVKKGRKNPNYLDAIGALSTMKYEGVYPEVIEIAKNGNDRDKRHVFVTCLSSFRDHYNEIIPLYAEWFKPAKGKDFIGLLEGNGDDVIRAMKKINRPECVVALKKIVENEQYDKQVNKEAEELIKQLESLQK